MTNTKKTIAVPPRHLLVVRTRFAEGPSGKYRGSFGLNGDVPAVKKLRLSNRNKIT